MLFKVVVKRTGTVIQEEYVAAPHALGACEEVERHYPGRWLTLSGQGGQPVEVYWTGLDFEAVQMVTQWWKDDGPERVVPVTTLKHPAIAQV